MSAGQKARSIGGILWVHYKTLTLILAPLILLPIPLLWAEEKYPLGGKMAYCLVLMATYWVTEVMPLAVTAMMPIFLFPLMGIEKTDPTCKAYFNDVQFLVIGGLMIAIAVETWNVHERIALSVLQLVGAKIRWIMLGFMLVTAILSMFISNTATTAMMTPIANAILDEIRKSKDQHKEIVRRESMVAVGNGIELEAAKKKKNSVAPTNRKTSLVGKENPVYEEEETPNHDAIVGVPENAAEEAQDDGYTGYKGYTGLYGEPENAAVEISTEDEIAKISVENNEASKAPTKAELSMDKMMLLSVCWSANLGGIGMLTGTTPNLVLKGHSDEKLGGELNFLNWSGFCIPTVFIFLAIAWIWLQIWFLGIKAFFKCDIGAEKSDAEKRIEALLKAKYKSLGKIKFAEITIMLLFLVLVILWFTRDLGFVDGYGSLFEPAKNETETKDKDKDEDKHKYLGDATPAILIPMLLFVIPATKPEKNRRVDRLLDWKIAQAKMPWNVIMLLGGGFALALGMESSELSQWIGEKMKNAFQCLDVSILAMLIAFVVTMTTEVASNTATTQIFTPIMSTLARETGVNPFNTLLPTAVAASFAFMLPVATPPNAIAFSYGKLTIIDMALPGIVMNLIGVLVIGFGMNTWGIPIFHLDNPDWPIPRLANITIDCS